MTLPGFLENLRTNAPLVFGHRGARAYAPMNTLPSFELAATQGAHGIELDVHRSKDGHPVIVHDFTVDKTTNGTGLVTQMTLSELKALDAGGWFGSQFAGVQIPTLDEVFVALGQRLWINIEIKAISEETDGVEELVADCIRRYHMEARVLVSSFNPAALSRFRALMPDIPIGYLSEGPSTEVPAGAIYEAFHPYYQLVTPQMVEECRRRNQVINVWTVNDPVRAVELAAMGVHCMITDTPDVLLVALKKT